MSRNFPEHVVRWLHYDVFGTGEHIMWPFGKSRFQHNVESSLRWIGLELRNIHNAGRHIMATQAEAAATLVAVKDKLVKIGGETKTLLTKIDDLKAALANAGTVTPELQAAIDGVVGQSQVVDDLVADEPAPPPAG